MKDAKDDGVLDAMDIALASEMHSEPLEDETDEA
jgi:hypothetical protein